MRGQGVGGVCREPGERTGRWRGVWGARCKVRVLVGCAGSQVRGQGVGGLSGSQVRGQGVGGVSGEPGVRSGCAGSQVRGQGVGGVFGEPGVRSECWWGVRGARCQVRAC